MCQINGCKINLEWQIVDLPDQGFDISCKPQKCLTIMKRMETVVSMPASTFFPTLYSGFS